ncbi:unnamed protein product, partial [Mesocestoides corti]|uniref:DZF domain-containing protein n=1 Tax=Mesocestoides corti TaxID=53468 RepID=A0A0R3UDF0_MESCO
MPSFSVVWPDYTQAAEGDPSKPYTVEPDRRIFTQILTKVVHHIDFLLEDWYPDLGTRFNQSNSGEYLVHRVIPCTACARQLPQPPLTVEPSDVDDAMSTLDNVLKTA